MQKNTLRINITITKREHELLKELADETGYSMSHIVRLSFQQTFKDKFNPLFMIENDIK